MGVDFASVDHRPFPLPDRPWAMQQTWRNLLFAHWAVDPGKLRALVPRDLELDLFDGTGWLAVTPLRMEGVRPRLLPPLPGASAFPELNVRTYVVHGGKPGVYFFSLDAGSRLAVEVARWLYGLPYMAADMRIEEHGEVVDFESRRTDERGGTASFHATYRGVGPAFETHAGTIEQFAVERYCLYSQVEGRLVRADIHHAPWSLRRAEATLHVNTMTSPMGLALEGEPHLLFSEGLDVAAWLPEEC
jgi:hypothetical protein